MTERTLWMSALALLAAPLLVVGQVSSNRLKPTDRSRVNATAVETLGAHATDETESGGDSATHDPADEDASAPWLVAANEVAEAAEEVPWWMQMVAEGPVSIGWGALELAGAVLTTFYETPGQLLELAYAAPELAREVYDDPRMAVAIGAAIVGGMADDAHTVAMSSNRAAAMRILGGLVADRISPRKLIAAAKKSRGARHAASVARKAKTALANAATKLREKATPTLCFLAGTPVHGANGFQPIETFGLGDRVATTDLALEDSDAADATWKRVSLEMRRGPDDTVKVELLRSPTWIAQTGAVEGADIRLSIPEMRLDGPARVRAVRSASIHPGGHGHLVVATFESKARDVVELRFEGTAEVIGATARHRLYSLDADGFVPAGKLRVGERLRTRDGIAVVASITKKHGVHTVYNIEVETDHSYFVGHVGVLSHNNEPYVYQGLPPNVRPPGVPVGHPSVDGDVRLLTLDDGFQTVRSLSSDSSLQVLLLRNWSNRAFVFREVGGDYQLLARAHLHMLLSQSAGMATAPVMPALYRGSLGVLQEIPARAREVPIAALADFIELTATFGDVRAIDYISGFERRTNASLRLFLVEQPMTFAVIPLTGDPFTAATKRIDELDQLSSSMSDRLYNMLLTMEQRDDVLRRQLAPYAPHVDVNALINEAKRAAGEVLEQVEARPISVLPHASPYVTVRLSKLIPPSDTNMLQRAQRAERAYLRGPISTIPFPDLSAENANDLRLITPTKQLPPQAMAAYREQVQLTYHDHWLRQELDPSTFFNPREFADLTVRQAVRGYGREMRALVETQESIWERFRVDIGEPYENRWYADKASEIKRPTPTEQELTLRALGAESIRQLVPRGDLLQTIGRRAAAQWTRYWQ